MVTKDQITMIDNYLDFLQKDMNVSTLKRNVIADNITNYNTPNFKANKVDFSQMFNSDLAFDLKATNNKHITMSQMNSEPTVYKDITTKAREDGNNVDLDSEMVDMLKNNNNYSEAVQAMNKEFFLMRTAMGK